MINRNRTKKRLRFDDEGGIFIQSSKKNYKVQLDNQLCQIFTLLLENENNLVTREELILQVWKENPYVGRGALTKNIWRLRRALQDGGLRELVSIETVPKRGYRLILERPKKEYFGLKNIGINVNRRLLYGAGALLLLLITFAIAYLVTSEEVYLIYTETPIISR